MEQDSTAEQRSLLADQTYETLKLAVLRNELPPGTSLSVPELARQLKVSRSPVREAVLRLIHDGLATQAMYRGAEVSRVDVEDLRQLYVVREALEGVAARLATEHLDSSHLEVLKEIVADHEVVVQAGADNAAHIELDMRFHREIRDLAGNPHLSFALEPIVGRSHIALHSLWRSPEAPRLALDEHRLILDAMIAGDADAAEAAAQRHVARLRVRLARAVPAGTEPVKHRLRPQLSHLA
ncbi:GntR family transcriptional regulator [Saxibacter everestensis]|uniref:GntR family transcriptional regulator n=1 Tax=Saxibacter everestensis TaxID=2909229 RepID=A0ABY8QSM0_9MICO|nr:GntR family transcriptional regulator [Brevibacteriaceae bacterium ZFBP1038]